MATKLELTSEFARELTERMAIRRGLWQNYLKTAARIYKYPFQDQIMIYGQRPDATACASTELWNKRMGRWVNRGEKGIALLDDSGNHLRLRYVFDVSQTYPGNYRPVTPRLWRMERDYQSLVMESLVNTFGGQKAGSVFEDQISQICDMVVGDNMTDYLEALMDVREGSGLEDLDEVNVAARLRILLSNSASYTVLTRCGIDADALYSDEDFEGIFDFSSFQVMNVLGAATSDISKMILLDMEKTIRRSEYEKKFAENPIMGYAVSNEKNKKKSTDKEADHGTDVYQTGRLPVSESDTPGAGTAAPEQVRDDAQEVSEGTQESTVQLSDAERGVGQASAGDRSDGGTDAGEYDRKDGTGRGADREDEGRGTHEVGGPDEQHPQRSGGADPERPDLRLIEQETEEADSTAKLPPLFHGFEKENTESAQVLFEEANPNEIPQHVIDTFLCLGSNSENSPLRIVGQYRKDLDTERNVAFLRKEFGVDGRGLFDDEMAYSSWTNEDGMIIAVGQSAQTSEHPVYLTWEQVDHRIRELLELGRYMPQSELDKVAVYECHRLAEQIVYTNSDDFSMIPKEEKAPVFAESRDYVTQVQKVENALATSEGLAEQHRYFVKCIGLMEKYPSSRRFHDVRAIAQELADIQGNLLEYHADMTPEMPSRGFITQDEVDHALGMGGGMESSKFRIYAYFANESDPKKRAAFLRDEYGTGGSYGPGKLGRAYDSKGIDFTRGNLLMPYATERLSWSKAAKRIGELITSDRYMTEEDKGHIGAYEREQLSREILEFYAGRSFEVPRPFPAGTDFYDVAKFVGPQLKDRERAVNLISGMQSVMENMTPDSRGYERMAETLAHVIEYQEHGTYLFHPEKAAESAIEESQVSPAESGDHNRDAAYNLPLGTEVYIGSTAYEINTLGDEKVILAEVDAPLFLEEMTREEFERKLRENPQNDHLQQHEGEATQESVKSAEKSRVDEMLEQAERGAELFEQTGQTVVAFEEGNPEPINVTAEPLVPPTHRVMAAQSNQLMPEVPKSQRRQYRITDEALGHGGPKSKYQANIDAIRTLQTLEQEGRLATPEEQEILAHYVGWGGLPQAFDESNTAWTNEYSELKALLTEEEYVSARASTLNAHYTSPVVIRAMYKALENMGFGTCNILEPACGIGNFFGMVPDSMAGSKLYGVELDGLTGRIARQLYQNADISICGFEKTAFPDSIFDVAVGNVPFGNYKVSDKQYDKLNFSIHDYFFAKTLDKVRPGGVIAFVTSSFTMDKRTPDVRRYIAQRADLLGAIRLPNNAFRENAGTDVVADILFIQKRDRIVDVEPDWVHLSQTAEGIPINGYFAENPDMVLGQLSMESTQYGHQACTCHPFPDADLSDLLDEAVSNIHGNYVEYDIPELPEGEEDHSIPADPAVRNFSYTLVDSKIYYREDSRMNPVEVSATAEGRIKGMIRIRDSVRKLITMQTEDWPDADIQQEQANLNRLYDAYNKKYGLLNSRGSSSAFSTDSSYPLLCSLEILDENGNLERKADMFTKRTIRPSIVVDHVDTASEALAVSLGEKACVDLKYMADLMGKPDGIEEITENLTGVIFRDPMAGEDLLAGWQTADEYLSGNVRQKLQIARTAAVNDSRYRVNVEALERVQPKDLTAAEISVRLGATWIPPEIVQEFMYELLKTPFYSHRDIKVLFSPLTAEWNVTGKSRDRTNVQANNTYGTDRANAYKIIEETLNLRDIRIFDYHEDANGNRTQVLNRKETAIAHILYGGNTLLAHEVGAGKSATRS